MQILRTHRSGSKTGRAPTADRADSVATLIERRYRRNHSPLGVNDDLDAPILALLVD